MDLFFLGTSAGTPTRSRNVSALAVLEESGRRWHLVDCGEGTQHQLLRAPLSLHNLSTIFISHVHGDHCYGLPGLIASAGMSGRKAPLKVIGPHDIEHWLRTTLTLTACHLPFELDFEAVERAREWHLGTYRVDAWPLSHRVPSYAYRFTEARPDPRLNIAKLIEDDVPKGPLWGRLLRGEDVEEQGRRFRSADYIVFDRQPRSVVVAGDNDQPELLREACQGAQVMVHEATYTQDIADRVGPGAGHSSALSVAQFAQDIELPNLLLTHFSARYQSGEGRSSIETLREEAASQYSGALFLAKDFQHYRLDNRGQLTLLDVQTP
jgi:ribonuclease Z